MTAPPRLAFVVSSPRSGSTMLERMLETHSQVLGGPEPHLITPLAHLGLWASPERAPYDLEGAASAVRAFVDALPEGEPAYYRAVRAYCDTIYGLWQTTQPGTAVCLDKTPAYGLILPFLERLYPDARYIVLTRHPVATFASYANSFFDGDYAAAEAYNPILDRYVPALARFLREGTAARLHIRYEDLVAEPEAWMERACAHLELPFEPGMVSYGASGTERPAGLGDPIGVAKHERPVTDSVGKWPLDLLRNADALRRMEAAIGRLHPDDLTTLGYPPETIWTPLEEARTRPLPPAAKAGWSRYRVQRVAILRLRQAARGFPPFRSALMGARRFLEALLPPA